MNTIINIFIAYSRADRDELTRLRNHLSLLERKKHIKIWYDGLIEPGSEWDATIKTRLEKSEIILLLISSDFFASDYCYEVELARALKRHEDSSSIVIPIIARDCLWDESNFAHLQVLPENGIALTSPKWETLDTPYTSIAREVSKIAKRLVGSRKKPNLEPKEDRLLLKQETDVVSTLDMLRDVKKIFNVSDDSLALLIFHLGNHKFDWRTRESLLLKTGVAEKAFDNLVKENSRYINQRIGKTSKKQLFSLRQRYRLLFQKHFVTKTHLQDIKINYYLLRVLDQIKAEFEVNEDRFAMIVFNLCNIEYTFRSISSLARIIGVKAATVKEVIIRHDRFFKQKKSKSGKSLVALHNKYRKIADGIATGFSS